MKNKIFKIMFVFIIAFFYINVDALKSTSDELKKRNVCENIELALANSDGTITSISCYDDYDSAKKAMNESTDDDLIILGKYDGSTHVIDAKYALFNLNHGKYNQNIYSGSNLKTSVTYMNNDDDYGGVEGAYLGVNYSNKAGKIKINGVTGWIKKLEYQEVDDKEVKLIDYYIVPLSWVKSTSYYQVTKDNIKHFYATDIESGDYNQWGRSLGPKPLMLEPGKYYSYDGIYFYTDLKIMLSDYKNDSYENSVNKDKPYYNYYLYLPHRTRTNYTIDDMDIYLRNVKGFNGSVFGKQLFSGYSKYSALYGTSEYYMKAEELYGANAISVFGLSMNESGNGRSKIAIEKNNVFGHSAYDGMAYDKATGYMDIRSSIYSHAYSYINYGYSEVSDDRYYGGHFGNKLTGMNVKYASDVYWGEKAVGYYYEFDKDNGMLDYNYYQLIISKGTKIYTRTEPNTSSKSPYMIPYKGIPFVLIEEVEGQEINGSKIWYKIQSDSNITNTGTVVGSNSTTMPQYNWEGYVYVHSSFFEKINEASKNEDGTYHKPVDVKKDNIDDSSYNVYATKTEYNPKVGLLNKDTDYYHTSTLLNKKGTLKANTYVTILMENKNGEEVNYLVITNYSTYQRHWISSENVKIVEKDLLKVDITDSGKYISVTNKPNGTEVFKVYTDNQLVIVDKTIENDKLYLKVQYQNENEIFYGYVDSTIANIKFTIDNINKYPVINASDIILIANEDYDLKDNVTVTDTEDGNLWDKLIVDSNINIKKPGTYEVTYSVVDSYGNKTVKTVKAIVKERENKNGLFMYNELKHDKDNSFTISGFMGIKGMDNKIVKHSLIFVNELTSQEYVFNLDNWQEYPYEMSSLDDNKAYDYSGGWFKSTIDLSKESLPNGDYTLYVKVVNGNYEAKELFTNIAYMPMTRRATGNSREFLIEVDYSTLNSPLLFSVRDTLLTSSIPKTFDPMYNFFNEIKLDNTKLTLKGTSHSVGVSFSEKDDVKRQIIFEEKETFVRYSFDLDSITNGDYPITLAVSDNCDKTRAWYNKTIDLKDVPKGNYIVYIVNNINGVKNHGELIDVMYTDFTKINNDKFEFKRNDDKRLRLELTVKE